MVKKLIKIGVDVNQEISPDGDAESAGDEERISSKTYRSACGGRVHKRRYCKVSGEARSDVNKKDGDGNTAYDVAKENQFFSDVDFLK